MSTQYFEKFAMAAFRMPMIASLDQLVDLNESTEIIRKNYMKSTFEADGELVENASLNDDNLSVSDFFQTEIATKVVTKKT